MAEQPLDNPTEENKQPNIEVGDIHVDGNVYGNIIVGHGNIINLSPAQQVFRSLHQLPQPPADFTGREELISQLLTDFEKGKGATITGQPIHGLVGMGGIGKTALGLVVAHQLKKDYPEAQIFLDLKGTTTPLSAMDIMRHVILSFEPTMDVRTTDEAEMSAKYQSVLYGKHALLFFDNARSAEQVAPLRPPETCALLLTSRWTFPVPGLDTHHVNVMSEGSAKAFLVELCPRIGDQATAGLAEACAYLPLALRIAGSFLNVNDDYSIEVYLTELDDKKARLGTLGENRKEAELRTEPDVLAAFKQSYDQLAKEEAGANLQKYWRTLGVFPASFQSTAVEAIWELDAKAASKRLRLYRRYSLIDFDETTLRYSLHDLLATYAFSQIEEEEEKRARLNHASHYNDVLETANHLYVEDGEKVLAGLRLFDLEWKNIQAGQAWVSQNRDDKHCLELLNEYPASGYILALRLHPGEYIVWLEHGLDAARRLRNKQYEGYHLGNLANAYRDLGNPVKALDFYVQAFGIAVELGDRRGEEAMLANRGNFALDMGNGADAMGLYLRHLDITRELGDRRGEGQALRGLGLANYTMGYARDAIEFYEQALGIAREIGDRRGEGDALGSMGIAYRNLGEVRKAIEFHEQALGIAREIGDRRGERNALGSLGDAYRDLGEDHQAIEFFEGQLAIAREMGDRLGEGNALFSIGRTLYDLQEKDRAIDLVKRALQSFDKIIPSPAAEARQQLKEWGAL